MSHQKFALITGASRGIGKAIAYEFARKGYHLYLTCKNNIDLLKCLKTELEQEFSTKCHIFQCDMANHESVKELFSVIPKIDILVNNAGISYVGLLTDMSYADWRNIMDTNLDSLFHTCKYAVPKMLSCHSGKSIHGQLHAGIRAIRNGHTAAQNHQSRHGADHNGVQKHLYNSHKSLLYRMRNLR